MTETAQAQTSTNQLIFRARQKSIVAALALLIAGLLAFVMNMDRLFFMEAMAWTFLIWGLLLMYNHLIDYTTTYEVTDEALILRSPLLPWKAKRVWDWDHIYKMNLVVERLEAEPEDVEMQIFYTPEGSTVIHREDINYLNPELARLVAERAGLKPKRGQAMQSFDLIPQEEKNTYTWE